MKIGIMQPYFFPYIGYWQLLNYVDKFVVYDNIQYEKKGWIKHNRIKLDGKDYKIGVTLKKDSDYLDVVDRYISDDYDKERIKILNVIKQGYKKTLYFEEVYPYIEKIIMYEEKNLFKYLYYSICIIKEMLDIKTEIVISSTINIDHKLKSEKKVIALTKALNGDIYTNPIGGTELYSFENFTNEGIKLEFLKADNIEYDQPIGAFIPYLSIIDVLMNNGIEKTKDLLNRYKIYDSKEKLKELK